MGKSEPFSTLFVETEKIFVKSENLLNRGLTVLWNNRTQTFKINKLRVEYIIILGMLLPCDIIFLEKKVFSGIFILCRQGISFTCHQRTEETLDHL